MKRVIDAYELDGQLFIVADAGKGSTYAVQLPAGATKKQIHDAICDQLAAQEATEKRKVRREDLVGDLQEQPGIDP